MTESRARSHLPTPTKTLGQYAFFDDTPTTTAPTTTSDSITSSVNRHSPVTIPKPSSQMASIVSSPLVVIPTRPPRKLSYPMQLPDFVVGSIPHYVPVPWPNSMTHAPMTPDFITSLEKRAFLSRANSFSEDDDGAVFDMEDPTVSVSPSSSFLSPQ
ncbi:hypothetical protein PHYBLDRAFT_163517 [Phycomyces blakesleeanus NRRL 1555(-)]|uniref:Uncharacterized protein n=1 Tax=Phycomyces blakesleeanus (strain ATCC 8743b / DSM 1359 / FGSC 10004 / NBRC 33097 / NRRL 1555) TaxID=763407 RepID=A0A163EFT0_PHYB8|nr:hypothetical protein PHYBLDRAFT_163517 [Phycomyces blakesleeanus NRRL 1555(-)]OAD78400.1 hypothetical protein PHYBLDRAFT_163517 [Phycomyces blakesleeanus NRRL 1555(-)]|eukprot:XP_018296440.1 hypothetical protein PHYBLDRAFT_163517 [Phycomyces blakesleeanus NRRL 1555(-)]